MSACYFDLCMMIQRDLVGALEEGGSQSYDASCCLSPAAKEKLGCWTNQLASWNRKGLDLRQPDLQRESDTSLIRWGASCQGTKTGGPKFREKNLHINCLELLAATLVTDITERSGKQVSTATTGRSNNSSLHHQSGRDGLRPGKHPS